MVRIDYGEIRDLTKFLDQNPNIYAIDSKLSHNLKYMVTDEELIVAYDDGEMHHKISEVEKESMMYKKPVRDEILAIYEDIKDLARMEITWKGIKVLN